MEVNAFIKNYKAAFSNAAELPIVFWYSDNAINKIEKINGCLFKCMQEVRIGNTISLNADNIGCSGGKFYAGFSEMPEHVPNYVSNKEKYKQTPEMVLDFLDELQVPSAHKEFLHFARIDKIENFDHIEGILFLATPDILSGLIPWAYFDNNADNAVASVFGSGCSIVLTETVIENRKNGKRTFIGLFDPSVRPCFESNILSFTIPMSRFKTMYHTMTQSCLFNTNAWIKIRSRIEINE